MHVSQVILEARGLEYSYEGGTQALSGLDLTVAPGRRLAILGANGAGKSTLLLHLNGTLRPDRGTVYLDGHPADYSRRGLIRWRQQVGLVLQDPDDQLFAASVYQDVSFGPLNLGLSEAAARQRVEEALAALEIEHLRDRPTHLLSFGQKKRVAIAGVVAMRPRVLVLDEPTAGLDPAGVQRLLATLDRLHRAGTTLILATHDMDLAYGWADEVAVLHRGAVLRQGPPEVVLQDAALLASAGLRTPWVLEVGRRLAATGWIPPAAGLPRTREELLAGLPDRDGSTRPRDPAAWTVPHPGNHEGARQR